MNGAFVEQAITFRPTDSRQEDFWRETVTLNDVYFQSLKKRAVPLQQAAIAAISNRSMALDVYTWLAYRLHALTETTTISWNALHQQFGAGFKELRKFRVTFTEALRFAMAVYPEARVQVEGVGLELSTSSPPVSKRSFQVLNGGAKGNADSASRVRIRPTQNCGGSAKDMRHRPLATTSYRAPGEAGRGQGRARPTGHPASQNDTDYTASNARPRSHRSRAISPAGSARAIAAACT
jgi:Plasmid encoded RepA protein